MKKTFLSICLVGSVLTLTSSISIGYALESQVSSLQSKLLKELKVKLNGETKKIGNTSTLSLGENDNLQNYSLLENQISAPYDYSKIGSKDTDNKIEEDIENYVESGRTLKEQTQKESLLGISYENILSKYYKINRTRLDNLLNIVRKDIREFYVVDFLKEDDLIKLKVNFQIKGFTSSETLEDKLFNLLVSNGLYDILGSLNKYKIDLVPDNKEQLLQIEVIDKKLQRELELNKDNLDTYYGDDYEVLYQKVDSYLSKVLKGLNNEKLFIELYKSRDRNIENKKGFLTINVPQSYLYKIKLPIANYISLITYRERSQYKYDRGYRKTNIKYIYDGLPNNMLILRKGESFSFNNLYRDVNKITPFLDGYGVIDDKEVKMAGGGVCGGATGIYQSLFLVPGLNINSRNHGTWYDSLYKVSINGEYIATPGLDATYFGGSVDLKVTNENQYPIVSVNKIVDGNKEQNYTFGIGIGVRKSKELKYVTREGNCYIWKVGDESKKTCYRQFK